MIEAAGVREDAWLAGVLGYGVYAVEPDASDAVGAHERDRRRALYYAKVPVDRVEAVGLLTAAGFSVVDVNVTLAHRDRLPPRPSAGVAVAPLEAGDADRVLEIAGSCFRYSRFHLDPAIPQELAHRVKREWVTSYVSGARGAELLVATFDGRPAGFLAVLEAADGARVIDLVGVDEAVQLRGVGATLVEAFLERHGAAPELRVGTQIANVASLALYRRSGFEIVSSAYVLHLHVGA